MYGYIYKTTNLINGKIYIGQHKATIFESNNYLGSGNLIKRAIKKYGEENFKVELIDIAENQKELDEKEIYWITYFNAKDMKVGYNISDGGFSNRLSEDRNGNSKVTIDDCSKIKHYLDLGYSINYICELFNYSYSIVSRIRRGEHWSCKYDNYVCKIKKPKICSSNNLSEEERNRRKIEIQKKRSQAIKLKYQLIRNQREIEFNSFVDKWIAEKHKCLFCGKEMTKYHKSAKYGDGVYCSTKCIQRYVASKRTPEHYIKIVQNRGSMAGENNPNFGHRMSQEKRKELSEKYKNSQGVKNSPRFKGHKHTEESKKKISEAFKKKRENKNEQK